MLRPNKNKKKFWNHFKKSKKNYLVSSSQLLTRAFMVTLS